MHQQFFFFHPHQELVSINCCTNLVQELPASTSKTKTLSILGALALQLSGRDNCFPKAKLKPMGFFPPSLNMAFVSCTLALWCLFLSQARGQPSVPATTTAATYDFGTPRNSHYGEPLCTIPLTPSEKDHLEGADDLIVYTKPDPPSGTSGTSHSRSYYLRYGTHIKNPQGRLSCAGASPPAECVTKNGECPAVCPCQHVSGGSGFQYVKHELIPRLERHAACRGPRRGGGAVPAGVGDQEHEGGAQNHQGEGRALGPAAAPDARVLIIGLGVGGVNARLRLSCPNVREIQTVEPSEQVISVSKRVFGFKTFPEDDRVERPVALAFGGEFVAKEAARNKTDSDKYDMVIVEAFLDSENVPEDCSSQEFYSNIDKILKPGGLFNQNLIYRPNITKTPPKEVLKIRMMAGFQHGGKLEIKEADNGNHLFFFEKQGGENRWLPLSGGREPLVGREEL